MAHRPRGKRRGWLAVLLLLAGGGAASAAKRSPLLHYAAEPGVEALAPTSDQASLVLLRPSKAWGGTLSTIRMDGEPLSALTGRTASVHLVAPGVHLLESSGEDVESLSIALKAGSTYHVLVDPDAGRWSPNFLLRPIEPGTGDADRLQGWLSEVVLVEGAGSAAPPPAEPESPQAAVSRPEPHGIAPAAGSLKPEAPGGKEKPPEIPTGKDRGYLVPGARPVKLEAPPPGKATLVLLRVSNAWKGAHSPVFDGEEFLTFLVGQTAYVQHIEPGEHSFRVQGEVSELLAAQMDAGRTYFVVVQPYAGKWKPRFRWEPLQPGTPSWRRLSGWLEQLDPVTPTDEARSWAAANRDALHAAWARQRGEPDAEVGPEAGVQDLGEIR